MLLNKSMAQTSKTMTNVDYSGADWHKISHMSPFLRASYRSVYCGPWLTPHSLTMRVGKYICGHLGNCINFLQTHLLVAHWLHYIFYRSSGTFLWGQSWGHQSKALFLFLVSGKLGTYLFVGSIMTLVVMIYWCELTVIPLQVCQSIPQEN